MADYLFLCTSTIDEIRIKYITSSKRFMHTNKHAQDLYILINSKPLGLAIQSATLLNKPNHIDIWHLLFQI